MCISSKEVTRTTVQEKKARKGYRLFRIHPDGNWLTPIAHTRANRSWRREVARSHRSPFEGRDFGFHAYTHNGAEVHSEWKVRGIVEGWGEMVLHRTGWRSQYARIIYIAVPRRLWRHSDMLQRAYPHARVRRVLK